MSPVWTVLGAALVLGTLADVLWSTLTFNGAGPVGRWVLDPLGRRLAGDKVPGWVRANATIVLLVLGILTWTTLVWLGWTLVFCGSESAVLVTPDRVPADFWGRAYFAGFAITTLGVGDLVAGGAGWQLAVVLAAATGFVTVSLLVAYLLAVVAAVHERRAIGAAVGHLGPDPLELVGGGAADGFSALSDRLMALTARLEVAAQQVDAFPVLGHAREVEGNESFAVAVAALGETALLLAHAVDAADRPPEVVTRSLRRALVRTMKRLHEGGGPSAGEVGDPPPPDFAALAGRLRPHGVSLAPRRRGGLRRRRRPPRVPPHPARLAEAARPGVVRTGGRGRGGVRGVPSRTVGATADVSPGEPDARARCGRSPTSLARRAHRTGRVVPPQNLTGPG